MTLIHNTVVLNSHLTGQQGHPNITDQTSGLVFSGNTLGLKKERQRAYQTPMHSPLDAWKQTNQQTS